MATNNPMNDEIMTIEELRELYLADLRKLISHDGQNKRPRVRKPSWYEKIPTYKRLDETEEQPADNIWVWSDTHFGHKNVIEYCNRPFEDLDDMAHQLIANHNSVVGDNDLVMWVGDVAFLGVTRTNEILGQLNGRRELIVGNHDIVKGKVKNMDFSSYGLLNIIEDFHRDIKLIFTHFPMENMPDGWINVHGHIHNSHETNSLKHINVSVEVINYTPMHLNDIIEMAYHRTMSMENI